MPKSVTIPIILLLAVATMCAFIVSATAFGMLHDDGIYLVTAKALAEGKGYNIISLPNDPPQTKYPILLPLLLSAVWRINPHFPDNGPLLKVVPVTIMLAWLVLCYWFARRYGQLPPYAALWLVFFVAVNQWSLFNVGTLMSDTLFSALALAAIALLANEDRHSSLWMAAAAALVTGAAYYSRTAGLPLALAGVVALAAQRRFKAAAAFGGIVSIFLAGWTLWQRQAVDSGTFLENFYTAKGYVAYNLISQHYALASAIRIVAKNIFFLLGYPTFWIFGLVVPYSFRYIGPLIGIFFWLLIYRGLKRAPSWLLPAEVFLLFYLGMLALYIWPPDRLLLPTLPLLLVFAYLGMPRDTPRFVIPVLAVMPLVLAFYSMKETVDHQVATLAEVPWNNPDPIVDWPKISQVHNWIREHAPPGAIVMANYDPALYLYSGHKSIRPYWVAGANLFYGLHEDLAVKTREYLRIVRKYRPRYLVETGHDDIEEPNYAQILAHFISTGQLRLVQQIAPHYRIFEVVPFAAATAAVTTHGGPFAAQPH